MKHIDSHAALTSALLLALVFTADASAQRITNAVVDRGSGEARITLFGFGFGDAEGTVFLFVAGTPTPLTLTAPWSEQRLEAALPTSAPGTYAVAVRPVDRQPVFFDVTLGELAQRANFAPAPETGQTACWDELGTQIPCEGTGQDGDLRRGVKPPSPRFVDRNDGTVLDALTGIVWLKDWECLGRQNWQIGLDLVAQLADGQCDLNGGYQPGDFALPSVKEIETVINYDSVNGLPADNPFNFIPGDAWTSTSYLNDPTLAWTFGITTPIPGFLRPKPKDQGNRLPAVYVR